LTEGKTSGSRARASAQKHGWQRASEAYEGEEGGFACDSCRGGTMRATLRFNGAYSKKIGRRRTRGKPLP